MADYGVMLNLSLTPEVRWRMGVDSLPINSGFLHAHFTAIVDGKPDEAEMRRFTLALADFVNNYR